MDNVCFNVLSLNVRGIRDLHKRKSIFTWVRNQKADIIFLQETYSTPDFFQSWKFQWPGDMYFSHGSNHSKGVLLLIRETLQFELKSVRKDSHGRFIIVEALVQDSPVLLMLRIRNRKRTPPLPPLNVFVLTQCTMGNNKARGS